MKEINYNKIKDLMDEFDVDFKIAKKALKKSRGNYQGAVFYIDHWKRKKNRISSHKLDIFIDNLLGIIKYKFEAKKDDKVLLSINVLVVITISILISIFSYRTDLEIISIILMLFVMYHRIEIALIPGNVSTEEVIFISKDVPKTQKYEQIEFPEEEDEDFYEVEV